MAKRRLIDSSIDDDEWFGELSFFERDLWRALFTKCADDQGRLLDNALLIRSSVYPYKNVDPQDIERALCLFEDSDWRIYRYKADGKKFIQIVNWWEHQPMQWASPSKWPAPEGWQDHVRTRENNRYKEVDWLGQSGNAENGNKFREYLRSKNNIHLSAQVNAGQAVQPGGHVPVPVPVPDPVPVPVKTLGADVAAPAGPEPPTEPESPKQRARSQHDEVRLALEVHFSEQTGLPRPETATDTQKRSAGALWWQPLRSIAELCAWDVGESTRLIDAAISQLKGRCTIASPKSILATALAIKTGNAGGNGQARASPAEPAGWADSRRMYAEILAEEEDAKRGNKTRDP